MTPTRPCLPRTRLAAAALAALLLVVASFAVSSGTAAAAEHPVSEGRLLWSLKESWRKYIGPDLEVGDGTEITGWVENKSGKLLYPEGFSFPVGSGSYDDESSTTTLRLEGYVRFRGHCAAEAPEDCLLDTKFSDLEVEIGPEAQVLRGTHTGYLRTDPGGELHEEPDVVLAKFDIAGATTDFGGGESKWTGIPTVAGPGFSIYGESTVLDPTSFEYVGPGGIPDLSEKWDTPGAPGLDPGGAWLSDSASGARVLHASPGGEVVHTVDLVAPQTVDAELVLAARDAETLEPVGTPFVWAFPGALIGDRHELRTAFDPATESIFFVTCNEGEARNLATVRRAVWNPEAGAYEVEEVGSLGALTGNRRVFALAWNAVEDELAAIAYSGSTADKYETDTLHRFHLDEGAWVHEQAPLRLPDEGEWAGAGTVVSPFASFVEPDSEPLAVARDGSYVAAAGTGRASVGGTPHHYPALHIAVGEGGAAEVSPIDGTTTPRTSFGTYYGFASLAVDADGSLLLHNSNQVMDAYVRIDVEGGEAVKVGEIVDAPEDAFAPFELAGFANSMAADSSRGLVWATDTFSTKGHRLHALEGEEIVGSYVYTDFPPSDSKGGYARLEVGPDGSVYLPVKDPDSGRLGYRRLAFTGFVPEVTAQPEDQLVKLFSGEASKAVELSVEIADEADSIQWQRKAPGAAAFADLEGETAATLAVEATPAHDGSVYRARVSNDAGAIVSEEAALAVEYAPLIVNDLANRTVVEGADAVFLLSADANPEATVQWQRRVGGFWQPIDAADDNFELTEASLTVLGTNTEQTGSLFRAKLSNPVGATYSRQARLTVEPRVEIPAGGVDLDAVSLEWTGNAELQKEPPFGGSNYFSAGASDGTEATYSSAAGNVRVFQVDAGFETPATYPTRAAHVAGGSQLVRLYGGSGRIEPDGSASVAWEGAFTVNFYGGLVPFTFSDLELEVDPDGDGTLVATMVGCESSKATPGVCVPFAAQPGVTVATFAAVEVVPGGEVEVQPDYEGVEVDLPEGVTDQNRGVEGWGAWPQSFVDFQVKTGLTSYWYSSGGSFDADKPPHGFLVDFAGEGLPPAGAGAGSGDPLEVGDPPSTPSARRPALGRIGGARGAWVGGRTATVLRVSCRGPLGCAVRTRRMATVTVGGKRFRARVLAPRRIAAGRVGRVRLRLPKAGRRALAGHRGTARVWVGVRSGDRTVKRRVRVVLRGARRGLATKRISRSVGESGWVAIGRLRCPARPCRVGAPEKVATRVGGRLIRARVIGPQRLAPGRSAKLKLKLSQGALARLSDRSAKLRVKLKLRAGKKAWARLTVVTLKRRAGGGGAGSGESAPESEPISNEPPLLARPATAVDVSGVSLAWHPRDSWMRYVSSGVGSGDGISITDGASGIDSTASACPDRPSASDAELPYEIRFGPKASWYDPASGTAGIYGQGAVSFRWKAHTIDLTASEPEIEINGADSRAIFRFSGSEGTPFPDQRADLVSLDLSGQPTVSGGGKTFSYDLVRGTLTENGVNVFAGFYTPPSNDEFGCVSVSFTTP